MMPYIRSMRSEKERISFCASRTESSGVFMMPLVIKCRRESSSSCVVLGLITHDTKRSRYLMNQMRKATFVRLKNEWNDASTTEMSARFSV